MRNPEKDKGEGRRQGRDAYDWFVLIVAVLALVTAGAAAWFTWEQAAVARDQMQRALRAYLVVTSELAIERDTGRPYVMLAAENMGQTPVYDLAYFVRAAVVDPLHEPLPSSDFMRVSCANQREIDWEAFTATFSKTNTKKLRLLREGKDVEELDAAFSGNRLIYAYGTAYYRDIFGNAHAYPFCQQWITADYGPIRCSSRE